MELQNSIQSNQVGILNQNSISNDFIEASTNWEIIDSSKNVKDAISTASMIRSLSDKMTVDDIVNKDICSLEIKPKLNDNESCTVVIKMNSRKKITKIGVVSEASVLEIFQEFGEYAKTIFAEFVDEFLGATVYYAEIEFDRPTSESSIKFTRIKNNRSTMYLYGIRLLVKESKNLHSSNKLDFNLITSLLNMSIDDEEKAQKSNEEFSINASKYFHRNNNKSKSSADPELKTKNNNPGEENVKPNENLLKYNNSSLDHLIEKKFNEMEQRLVEKIDLLEINTNKKLNDILRLLESMKN